MSKISLSMCASLWPLEPKDFWHINALLRSDVSKYTTWQWPNAQGVALIDYGVQGHYRIIAFYKAWNTILQYFLKALWQWRRRSIELPQWRFHPRSPYIFSSSRSLARFKTLRKGTLTSILVGPECCGAEAWTLSPFLWSWRDRTVPA